MTRHGAGAGQPGKSSAQIPAEAVERGSGAISLMNLETLIPWDFFFFNLSSSQFFSCVFILPVHLGPSIPKTRVSAVENTFNRLQR